MFFDIDLLVRRDRGKFSTVWVVATRGIKKVTRKQIEDVDVSIVSDELTKMITSSSNVPRRRLSLSLSARLINGVIKIYLEQLKAFEANLEDFYRKIQRPLALESEKSKVKTPGKPKKKKGPVTSQDVEALFGVSPDVLGAPVTEADLAAGLALVSVRTRLDYDEITMREEFPQGQTSMYEGSFADGLDANGRLIRGGQIFMEPIEDVLPSVPVRSFLQDGAPSTIIQETDRTIQPPFETPQPPSEIEITQPQPPFEEAVLPRQPADEFAIPAPPPEEPRGVKRPAVSPPALQRPEKIGSSSERSIPPDQELMPPPRARRGQPKAMEKLLEPGKPLRVARKRCKTIFEEIDLSAQPVIIRTITTNLALHDDALQLLEELPNIEDIGDIARDARRGEEATPTGTPVERAPSDSRTPSAWGKTVVGQTTPLVLDNPLIEEAVPPRREGETPQTVEEAFLQPSIVIEEPPIFETPRIERPADRRVPIKPREELLPVAAQMAQRSPAKISDDKTRDSNERARLARIIKIMKNWDFTSAELTIDDVGQRPLNKYNVAQAFGDLAVLVSKDAAAFKYHENSRRVRSYEKGPKFPK